MVATDKAARSFDGSETVFRYCWQRRARSASIESWLPPVRILMHSGYKTRQNTPNFPSGLHTRPRQITFDPASNTVCAADGARKAGIFVLHFQTGGDSGHGSMDISRFSFWYPLAEWLDDAQEVIG
jgi:hypothetical protein